MSALARVTGVAGAISSRGGSKNVDVNATLLAAVVEDVIAIELQSGSGADQRRV